MEGDNMSEIREKWIEEAKRWSRFGDPDYDKRNDDPKELSAAQFEIGEKTALLKKLLKESEKAYEKFIKELTGLSLAEILTGAAGATTVGGLLNAVAEKHGKAIAKSIAEVFAEEAKEDVSSLIDKDGNPFDSGTSKKKITLGRLKRVGAKLAGCLLAGGGGFVLIFKSVKGLYNYFYIYAKTVEDIEILEKAIRYEVLEATDGVDGPSVNPEFEPPEDIKKKLAGKPPCKLFVQVTFRWVNGQSGATQSHEERARLVEETRGNSAAYAPSIPVPPNADMCFLVADVVW